MPNLPNWSQILTVIAKLYKILVFFPRLIFQYYQKRKLASSEFVAGADVLYVAIENDKLKLLALLPNDINLTVASNDPATRSRAKNRARVDDVIWTEDVESVYQVSDDVLKITDKINSVIYRCNESARDVCAGAPHFYPATGYGREAEKMVLYLRSYLRMLASQEPDYVLYRPNQKNWLQSTTLHHTLQDAGVHIMPFPTFEYRLSLNYAPAESGGSLYHHLFLPFAYHICVVATNLKVSILMIQKRLDAVFRPKRPVESSETYIIGFLSYINSERYLNRLFSVMQGFDSMPGLSPVAICWNLGSGLETIRDAGLSAIEVESFYPIKKLPTDLYWWIGTLFRLRAEWDDIEDAAFVHQGASLKPILRPLVFEYVNKELLSSLMYSRATRALFTNVELDAASAPGGGAGVGRSWIYIARDSAQPLTFRYDPFPVFLEKPYFQDICDLYYTIGSLEWKRYKQQGVAEHKLRAVGLQIGDFTEFGVEADVEQSKEKIGLSTDRELVLFYAPSWFLPGRNCRRETCEVLEQLLQFVAQNEMVTLVVKPHPRDDTGAVPEVVQQHQAEDVLIVNSSVDSDHCVNIADCVITKASSVGFDALLSGTALISISLATDTDIFFQQFEGGAKNFSNVSAMIEFLEQLAYNPVERQEWLEQQHYRGEIFVENNFHPDSDPLTTVASDIRCRLEHGS